MVRLAALFLLTAAAAASQKPARPAAPPPVESGAVAETLFLVGDAGRPAKGGEPVLVALRHQLEHSAWHPTVAFLGDNLYPDGLPAPDHPEVAEMARRIDDQVDAVQGSGARVVFIPGSHDWSKGSPDGWEAVGVDPAKVREGLELTLRMLGNLFEKFGIEEINPQGVRFDPERHQAMTVREGTGAEPGTVVMVVQKGYSLNGRLIRPAMVIVAR